MTLSDPHKPESWKADPVLSARSAAAGFLRLNWDDAQVAGFGPWRIINNDAPLSSTSLEHASPIELLPELPSDTGLPDPDADPAGTSPTAAMDPEALEAIRAEAYAEGMAAGMQAGQAAAQEALANAQARDSALLRQVVNSLEGFAADQAQLFEPLKRLALHLAEQLVRAELTLSGSAIDQLVRQCLAHLDQPADKAVVCLHPDDLDRFKRFSDAAQGLRLEPDARLQPGSVRIEVNDSLVEDLIERRLEVLSRQLLGDAHARLGPSALGARQTIAEDAGRSSWPAPGSNDVTDLPYRTAEDAPNAPEATGTRAPEAGD